MYRVFTGIALNNFLYQSIRSILYGIPNARFIPEENLHITLNFIGEIDGSLLNDLADALAEIEFQSFNLKLQNIGIFPLRGNPEVLWIGINNSEKLLQLHKKINSVMTKLKIKTVNRKYHPHLTIARLKNTSNLHINEYIRQNILFQSPLIKVNEFILYQSFLTATNAYYKPLFSYLLD